MRCILRVAVALFLLLFIGLKELKGQVLVGADSVAYNSVLNRYLYYTRDSVGNWRLNEVLLPNEYLRKERVQGGERYFLEKDRAYRKKLGERVEEPIRKPDISFDLKANLSLSLSHHVEENGNTALPIGLRKRSYVSFEHRSNLFLKALYGDNLGLELSYNTDGILQNKKHRLNLYYKGEREDLVQRVEAGHFTFFSENPLVSVGGEDLFGVKGALRLGGLDVQLFGSKEESNERRIEVRRGERLRQQQFNGSDYTFAQHFFLSEFFAQQYDSMLSQLPLLQSDIQIEQLEVWVSSPNKYGQGTAEYEKVRGYTAHIKQASEPPSNTLIGSEEGRLFPALERLSPAAYSYHPRLGFLSLNVPLVQGQVLLVAYRYRYKGSVYEVGSLAINGEELAGAILAEENHTPSSSLWPLMMKNGYTLSSPPAAWSHEGIKVELLYKDYNTGIEQKVAKGGRSWLSLFGWDNVGALGVGGSADDRFDFIEGITYMPQSATLFLPHRRPFDTVPKGLSDGSQMAFPQLYDNSQREAKQERQVDRFVIKVEVESRGAEEQVVSVGSANLLPGSVRVLANGSELREGEDYAVNYASGQVALYNHLPERVEIIVQERNSASAHIEKTLFGGEASCQLTPGLRVGGTLVRYEEQSRRNRVRWGEETVRNLMWGTHVNYRHESKVWGEKLGEILNREYEEPIHLELSGAYAQLVSNFNSSTGKVILEDFEQGQSFIDLTHPLAWKLTSSPAHSTPEMRAQMAWFRVDPLLVREGAKGQPNHLAEHKEQRENPLVREVLRSELFESSGYGPHYNLPVPTLNLSFYPEERGPYNLSTEQMNGSGKMITPREMWGGMMRPLEVTNLEEARYNYIEFWLLDPFFNTAQSVEGEMVIELGYFHDDIVPDGKMAFETSLPKEGSEWGKTPAFTPQRYTFDHTGNTPLELQDTGLDGVTSEEERQHPRYSNYVQKVASLTAFAPWNGYSKMADPREDPAGDDYKFFLGEKWDQVEAPILLRYKYINGTEGNSINRLVQGVQSAITWEPDVEDLDRNFIFNKPEEERYLRYKVPISAFALRAGSEWVVAERKIGQEGNERWVKVRIPLAQPDEVVGGGASLKDVRSVRLFLHQFESETHLRLAHLRLVANQWARYHQPITPDDQMSVREVSIGSLNAEEDGKRTPIPYVTPPRVEREERPSIFSFIRENESALSIKFEGLEPQQPLGVYKEMNLDLRHYEHLSMYAHLESETSVAGNEVALFVRLGHDYTDNYYEVSIPLIPTPIGNYQDVALPILQKIVWPDANQLTIRLSLLPELKKMRGESNVNTPYTRTIEGKEISVKGFPTLGEISAVMIGVKSKSNQIISAEVWVNELVAYGVKRVGGSAFQSKGRAKLSELGEVSFSITKQDAGFGSVKHNPRVGTLQEVRSGSFYASLELGELLPKHLHLKAPVHYSYQKSRLTPLFSSRMSDLPLHALNDVSDVTLQSQHSLFLNEWHLQPERKNNLFSMFRFTYRLQDDQGHSPEYALRRMRRATSSLHFDYTPTAGNFLRLSSLWNRFYHQSHYREGTHNVRTQWDWKRSLNLRITPLKGLHIAWRSHTDALIYEPFSDAFNAGRYYEFQLLNKEILKSIWSLGKTSQYQGDSEVGYKLPTFEKRGLNGLAGSVQWNGNYRWRRGLVQAGRASGNPIDNSSTLQLLLHYNFTPLYKPNTPPFVKLLKLQIITQGGSTVQGFIPEAGKALGISFNSKSLAPSLGYILALRSGAAELSSMLEKGWVQRDNQLATSLSYYNRANATAHLHLSPFKGLHVELHLRYSHDKHNQLLPTAGGQNTFAETGNIKFSTIGLKGFFSQQIVPIEHTKALPTFLSNYLLATSLSDGLPSISSLLPNWVVRYSWSPTSQTTLARWLKGVELNHNYRGEVEVPRFTLSTHTEYKYLPQSIRITNEMNPVVGVRLLFAPSISVEHRYVRRKIATLLPSNSSIAQQADNELFTSLSYTTYFAPIIKSTLPLLQSDENHLTLQLSHSYTHSYLSHFNAISNQTMPYQGLRTHLFSGSVEYRLSNALSLRAFYQENRRQPLVSGYSFPIRHRSYGVLLSIRLL